MTEVVVVVFSLCVGRLSGSLGMRNCFFLGECKEDETEQEEVARDR
jgi:hypothetical protein